MFQHVEEDLSYSLMERILKDQNIPARTRVCLLTLQYRWAEIFSQLI